MQLRTWAAFAVAGVISLAACGPAARQPVDRSADEALLREGTKKWLEAYNAGDAEKIVAMYADDAVVMPPGAPPATSHDAMRAYVTADMAKSKAAGVTLVDGQSRSGVSGNLGWHQGSYTVTIASGETVDSGSYLEVWRKADGKWLIIRDIWNSDRPAAPAAAPAKPAS